MIQPAKMHQKKALIQYPTVPLAGSRSVAPIAIASVVNVPTKKNSSGSYHRLSGNRTNEALLKESQRFVACHNVPTTKSGIVIRVTRQKSASGLACASFSGAVRKYPVHTASAIAATFTMAKRISLCVALTPNETEISHRWLGRARQTSRTAP